MVAMGWGVVRDSLGTALIKIVFLGILYAGLTMTRDFLVVEAKEVEKVSLTEEEELYDLALVLTPLIIVVNLIFYFWIIASLNSTTEYLRNMNQTSKLRRHLRLRCLIITSLFVVGIWLILNFVQVFTNFLSLDQMWIMEAVMHANYLFILFGVAVLWRPTSTSKDYAMQMEVPTLGGDDNELELSCVVPSADDVDYDNKDGTDYSGNGNDPDHPNGLRINGAVAS
jgi:Lung seven transmembrane receptor